MKSLLSLFLLLTLSVISSSAETITFDILLFGNKIGNMTVVCEKKEDGSEFYTLETKSKAKFLWINHDNYTRYDVIYRNGKLVSSRHKEIENGEVKRWTNIIWNGSRYDVDSYKGKRSFIEVPVYSIVSVYFKDISKAKRIFYEAEADFNELIKSNEPDTWEFKSSDGNRNIYHFENGKIKSMEFRVSIATVKMIRVQ